MYISKAIVIEEYSLSCECLERLDFGLNSGWVSFRARFIQLGFFFRFRMKINPKKVLTEGGDRLRGPNARVSLEQPIIQLQTFVSLPTKKLQRANSKLTISMLQADERAIGRAHSQRIRDNEKLKKINERCRKDRLPALTLKLMCGDAPGSSVPLATYSATTEEAIVMRPTRRSSRWDVSHEYTENVETEVKTEDSPERLTVSFKFHEDKMK